MRKPWLGLVVTALLAVSVLAGLRYWRFRQEMGFVPPGVRLAGLDLVGTDPSTVKAALVSAYNEPVAVYYGDQRIILRPQVLGFQVDTARILNQAATLATQAQVVRGFVGQLLKRPLAPVEVPLVYTMDQAALDSWLADVAARYDHPPAAPKVAVAEIGIVPGQPGRRMDVSASRSRVVAALTAATNRRADLMINEVSALPGDTALLAGVLNDRMNKYPGISSLYLKDIRTGEEVALDADVAYSGLSTLKIAVLEELYRKLGYTSEPAIRQAIGAAVAQDSNVAANELLQRLGDGDSMAGVHTLTSSMKALGLDDTFMAAPFDRALAQTPAVVTAANSRLDYNTRPDPYRQTTPRDTGLLLEMVVRCSEGGGTLLAAYPDQITPADCQHLVDDIALDAVNNDIGAGLPPGTVFVHRHGYSDETRADVAAIWGPGGPYILSIFLFQRNSNDPALVSSTIKDLSAITWSFYSVSAGPVEAK